MGEEWGAQQGGAWWLSKAEREKKTKKCPGSSNLFTAKEAISMTTVQLESKAIL